MSPTSIQIAAAALFAIALAHTFSTGIFQRLATRYPSHSGVFHLLGEVEVVFGFWALVLVLVIFVLEGRTAAVGYVDGRNFTEPLFVFAIMVIAGCRPIGVLAARIVDTIAHVVPIDTRLASYFLSLSLLPLFGSLITEPAAMTLAALMLRDRVLHPDVSQRLKYATIGVLFVNVSIGGTLTHFAAPPVLMVAAKWGWDLQFMLTHFGWKSTTAVVFNALVVTLLFRREVMAAEPPPSDRVTPPTPLSAIVVSMLFLIGVVAFAHHPAVFMGLLLFFLGYSAAYPEHQDQLILRESLLVAFFLAGLVVLGGLQAWWLSPVLTSFSPREVYFAATALTAVTDNAALTYLGSLVEGLSDEFKYSLVAGAVTGGGLTVIANAPNPAGFSILRGQFRNGAINPLKLLAAAALPTLVAIAAFELL